MNTEKFHKLILSFSLACLLFIALDTFMFPKKQITETVKSKALYTQKLKLMFPSSHTYSIQTNRRQFDAYPELYGMIAVNDTINTISSKLINSLQKVLVKSDTNIYSFKVGYLTAFFGLFAVPFTFLCAVIFFYFLSKAQ